MKPNSMRLHLALLAVLAACSIAPARAQVGTKPAPAVPTAPAAAHPRDATAVPAALAAARKKAPPTELYEIVKVVDGDTIHIQRNGKVEKLRLLSVDTEEKIGAGTNPNSTKPPTVFGEECAKWAQEFFQSLSKDGKPPRIGLLFPDGKEHYDFYGRLLCHVILPDGTDYNLMIVEMGKSPYFSKYGFSEIEHEAFVAAQDIARKQQLGIWNPKTNVPATPDTPSARRPYEKLLPWWDARGRAVAEFQAAFAKDPTKVCDTDDPVALAAAAKAGAAVECFGEVSKVTEETDGALTVHFRASQREKAFVVRIEKAQRDAHKGIDFAAMAEEFHQNYVWFRTQVTADPKGYFRAVSDDPTRWRVAGK